SWRTPTRASPERQFPEPAAGEPCVMGVDVHRDGRAEVGVCAPRVAPVSAALAPEVQGRRPIDRVWTQAEISVPAILSLLMITSRTGRHAQVKQEAPARARVALEIGETGLRLIGDPSGIVGESACREDPRCRAVALEAEFGIVAQLGES